MFMVHVVIPRHSLEVGENKRRDHVVLDAKKAIRLIVTKGQKIVADFWIPQTYVDNRLSLELYGARGREIEIVLIEHMQSWERNETLVIPAHKTFLTKRGTISYNQIKLIRSRLVSYAAYWGDPISEYIKVG